MWCIWMAACWAAMTASSISPSVSAGALDSLDGMVFDTEVYIDAKPDSHAFAGERKRMTEADVMAMVNAAPPEGA